MPSLTLRLAQKTMPNQNRFLVFSGTASFNPLGALQIFESQQRPEVTGHLPIFWPFFGSPSCRVALRQNLWSLVTGDTVARHAAKLADHWSSSGSDRTDN